MHQRFLLLFLAMASAVLALPTGNSPLHPGRRALQQDEASSSRADYSQKMRQMRRPTFPESAITEWLTMELMSQSVNGKKPQLQQEASVLSKLSAPEAPIEPLNSKTYQQLFGDVVFFEGRPIYLDSHTPSVLQLKTGLAYFKTIYYSYDKPGDTRKTTSVRLEDNERLVFDHLLSYFDIQVRQQILIADMVAEKYGSIAKALQYGALFPVKPRLAPSWKSVTKINIEKLRYSLAVLRDILEQEGALQLINKSKSTVLRFQIDSLGQVKSSIRYMLSGEEYVLHTGEKVHRR